MFLSVMVILIVNFVFLELISKRRRSKPLRCHAALLPAAGIQPARGYVNFSV